VTGIHRELAPKTKILLLVWAFDLILQPSSMPPGARQLPGDSDDRTLAHRESRSDGLGRQVFCRFLWSALALCVLFATTIPVRADACQQPALVKLS
jgi:hypothetical protein